MALRVRVPYWATRGVAVRLNGETQRPGQPSSYCRDRAAAGRTATGWRSPAHGAARASDARRPTVAAIMYGPLVLAGRLGIEGLTYEMKYADPVNARRGEGMRGQPVLAPDLLAPSRHPGDWIRPVGDPSVDRRDVEVVAGSPGDWTERQARSPSASPSSPAPCRSSP